MFQLFEAGARKTKEMSSNEPNQNEGFTDANAVSTISVEEKHDLESQPEDACLDETEKTLIETKTDDLKVEIEKECETIKELLIEYSDKMHQLAQAQNHIQTLSDGKYDLDDQLLDARLQVASKNEQIIAFKSLKNQNEIKIDGLHKNVVKLQMECRVIKQQLASAVSRVHLLSNDNHALKYLVDALTTSNAGLIVEKFKLYQQLKAAQAEISVKDRQLNQASMDASKDQHRIQTLSEENAVLKNQRQLDAVENGMVKNENANFSFQIKNFNQTLETLLMEISVKDRQLNQASMDASEDQRRIQSLSEEKDDLDSELLDAHLEIASKNEEIITFKSMKNHDDVIISVLERDVENLQMKSCEKNQQVNQALMTIQTLLHKSMF